MQRYSKLSLIYFIIIITTIIFYAIITMYLHDPLQVWHAPFFRKNITYSSNIRKSAKAMIRNEDFDSVIIGNSHTENTSCKIAEGLFGGKFINLSISGSTIYEKNLILTYLLKRKPIKHIIYLLDEHYIKLILHPQNYDTKQYDFLYNDSPFDDLKIYLNNKYLFRTLAFSNSPKCIGKILNMDKPYAWEDHEEHKKRFGGFENWIKYRENVQIRDYFNLILDTPLDIDKKVLPADFQEKLIDYFNKYLFTNIKQYPDVKFSLIISPVSDIELARRIRDDKQFFAKYKEALTYLVSAKEKYKNLRIYAFNNDPKLSKIEDYKDATHYRTWVNHYILTAIKEHKYELNKNNIDEYLSDVYNQAKQFDYEYYYNLIK